MDRVCVGRLGEGRGRGRAREKEKKEPKLTVTEGCKFLVCSDKISDNQQTMPKGNSSLESQGQS